MKKDLTTDDKSHGDYITEWDIKKYMWLFQDFDVEAKKKEKALKKIVDMIDIKNRKEIKV